MKHNHRQSKPPHLDIETSVGRDALHGQSVAADELVELWARLIRQPGGVVAEEVSRHELRARVGVQDRVQQERVVRRPVTS